MPHRRQLLLLAAATVIAVAQALVAAPGARITAHAAPSLQTQFPLRDMNTIPTGIVTGPDGNLWDVDSDAPYMDRLTPSGTLSSFLDTAQSNGCFNDISNDIAAGADGNLWFTQDCLIDSNGGLPSGYISKVTTGGTITHYRLPDSVPYGHGTGPVPYGIAAGPDGNLWFTESNGNHVGKITTAGVITEYSVPTANANSRGITAGPDGNLWFVESASAKVAKLTTTGSITEYAVTAATQPEGIAAGPDGNLWFTERATSNIGRISTSGSGYTEFATPTAQSTPLRIISGPGGALWFTEQSADAIASITTTGTFKEYPVSLPAPVGLTNGPDGNIWYTASDECDASYNICSWIGRLPVASTCGDVSDTVDTPLAGPGVAEKVTVTMTNCGTSRLTNVSTTTTITPPASCGAAPAIPAFTATLAYNQTATGGATITTPSCVGLYHVNSVASAGGSQVGSGSTIFMVSNGAGSHQPSDFNGDGYPDLATGIARGSSINGVAYPAPVDVYYGSASGLTPAPLQSFINASPGMPPQVVGDSSAGFGHSVLGADVNGDGYSDLVIGIYGLGSSGGYSEDGGAVVLYGSPQGLTTQGAVFIGTPQQVRATPAWETPESEWSRSLASGDFNGDGYPDVLFGAPEDQELGSHSGSVTVMYGSASGLTSTQTVFNEASPGMPGPTTPGDDAMGWETSAGDFNKDGFADVAVGVPGKSSAIILYGSSSGLSTQGSQYLQGVGPYSAYTLAAGDFNGDGYSDLAVGSACANFNSRRGIVEVHYGTAAGLGSVPYKSAQEFWPTKAGMPVATRADYFGDQVLAGRFHGGTRDDLAIGIGGGDGFYILQGHAKGLGTRGSQLIADGTGQQSFGAADFNRDGYADLAVGETLGAPLAERVPTPESGQDTDIRTGSRTGLNPTVSLTIASIGMSFSVNSEVMENGFCGAP